MESLTNHLVDMTEALIKAVQLLDRAATSAKWVFGAATKLPDVQYVDQFLQGNTVLTVQSRITRQWRHWCPGLFTNESLFPASTCAGRGKGVESVTPSAQHHEIRPIRRWVHIGFSGWP